MKKLLTGLLALLVMTSLMTVTVSAEKADVSPNTVESSETSKDPRRHESWVVTKGSTAEKEWDDSAIVLYAPKTTSYAIGKKLSVDTGKKLTASQKLGEEWKVVTIKTLKDADITDYKVAVLNQKGTYLRVGMSVYFIDGVGTYAASTTTSTTVSKNSEGKKITQSWTQIDNNDHVYLDMS